MGVLLMSGREKWQVAGIVPSPAAARDEGEAMDAIVKRACLPARAGVGLCLRQGQRVRLGQGLGLGSL
tara:strand:- start:1508 stop:1711 length:204 start_codon:yes stop_codon:yes gene_type:complete